MATPYTKLYDSVLSKIKDFTFANLEITNVYDILFDYIRPATIAFYICKQDLSNRDDESQIFNIDLTDAEIEIISNYMVVQYLESNYINTPLLLKQTLPSTDFRAWSPANMLNSLVDLRDKYIKNNETNLSRYAWKKN